VVNDDVDTVTCVVMMVSIDGVAVGGICVVRGVATGIGSHVDDVGGGCFTVCVSYVIVVVVATCVADAVIVGGSGCGVVVGVVV